MTFDLAQMIADREAGTPGDFYVKSLRGYTEDYICTNHPDFQQSPHGNYVGETGLAAGHAKQRFEPDARRFARVPLLEAEIIRLTARVAELEGATITVNPLVWDDIAPHHSKAALPLFGSIRAESWGGDYSVVWSVPGMCDTFTHGKWATIEAAKAAAQADYDARIRSAITITSVTPATISLPRAEVEDAANTLDLAANWMEKAVKDKRIIGPEFHVPTLRKAARALTGEPS